MTDAELWDQINNIHTLANKAPIIKAAKKRWEQANAKHGLNMTGVCDLIVWMHTQLGKHSITPKAIPRIAPPLIPTVVPLAPPQQWTIYPKSKLGYVMQEIWYSGYMFEDCEKPGALRDFISPLQGKWEMEHKDLTVPQKNTYAVITKHYREWMEGQGLTPLYLARN